MAKKLNNLKEEAADLILLGNLLKKERSPEVQEQIAAVISEDISVREKIERIERLEEASSQRSSSSPSIYAPKGIRENRFGTTVHDRVKTRAEKNRSKVKNRIDPSSFFRYLFREMGRIKAFGNQTGILKGMKVKREIRTFFISFYQPLIVDCMNILNQLFGNSWRFLKKKNYNLIVLFKDYCSQVMKMRFTDFPYRDRNCIDELAKIEQLFLSLHLQPEYIDTILKSIDMLIENNRRNIPNLEALPKLIKKILKKGDESFSFHNIILTLNMLKYRKYLTVPDLINKDAGSIVDTDIFVCTENIQNEIDRFTQETILRLTMLKQEKIEIESLKNYLKTDAEGGIVLNSLEQFYDNLIPHNDFTFKANQNDIVPFTIRFLYIFSSVYDPLLHGKSLISELGPTPLFTENSFKDKTLKLSILRNKIENIAFKLPSFTRGRYLQIKTKNRGAIKLEAEVISYVDECIEHLIDIGKKVEQLVSADRNDEPLIPGQFSPINTGQIGKMILTFPGANRLMTSDHPMYGRTLIDVFSELVSVIYVFVSYLQDLRLIHMLGKETSIDSEINSRLTNLERIASIEIYSETQKLFS